jgi:hypothetical protein
MEIKFRGVPGVKKLKRRSTGRASHGAGGNPRDL